MPTLINNRYVVAEELGKGGMGAVYLVEDTLHDNQVVALKMIRSDLLGAQSLAQFKHEFAALAQLRHPNLVDVYDFGTVADSEEYFFTMEYVSGEDLPTLAARYYAAGILDYSWIYEIIVQVCRALQYIHSRGFIHYDVKPRNIRLTPEAKVKVMDFGLIGVPRGEGQLRLRGTPEYIAPELILGSPVDHRADLYSLGVSLYEIVTGSLPFKDDSSTVVLRQHLETAAELPEDQVAHIPEALRTLIAKLMVKDPEQRYASANEVIKEINALTEFDFPVETRETKRGYIKSGAFVGREFELARLQGVLMRMVQGKGRLILISGVAGVGKTRLVREVRLRAQMQRVLVCEGACHEHARTPYRPWISIFKQVIAYHRASSPELINTYASALVQLMPKLASTLGVNRDVEQPSVDKQSLLKSAADFLAATSRPLLLIVEDLHHADAETVELLDCLGQRSQQARLLLLAVYRDDEVYDAHPLDLLVRQSRFISPRESRPSTFGGDHPYELLHLDLLSEESAEDLLKSMLGVGRAADSTALSVGLLPRLMSETGGNPLFIESLMYNLVEEDLLQYDGEAWHIDLDNLNRTPVSIQEAALRRLSRLDSRSLELLRWAAVMGQWLDIDMLTDITNLLPKELFALISDATRRHVLVSTERGGEIMYRFSNDQMRMAIYNTLPAQERAQRHTRIGEALRVHYPEVEIVELLAWHFEQAGQYQLAFRYVKVSGDKARRVYANESALLYYSRALGFVAAGKVDPKPELLYAVFAGREDANRLIGNLQAQREDLEEMSRLALELDDLSRQVEVMSRQVRLATMVGNQAEMRQAAEDAVLLARQAGAHKLEADSLTSLGEVHYALSEYDKAYTYYTQALEIYRELGDPAGEARSLRRLSEASFILGRQEETAEFLTSSLKLYQMLKNRPGEADVLNSLGIQSTDYAKRRDYYERSLVISQSIGDSMRITRAYNNLALVYWGFGLYDRARDYIESAVSIMRELQQLAVLGLCLETLGRVYLAQEEYLAAQEVSEEGLALSKDVGARAGESILWFNLGRIALARGNPESARELMETAHKIQLDNSYFSYIFAVLAWLGIVHLELGDWESADRYTRESLDALNKFGATEYLPQDVWWLRYRVLMAAPGRVKDDPVSEEAWEALQNARITMLESIATLSDQGLRRNYLNKVKINREIINEWTRQLAYRGEEQVLDEVTSVLEMDHHDEATELSSFRNKLRRVLDISVRMNETHDANSLLNYVMDQVIELSGAERGFLVLLDAEGQFDFKVAMGVAMDELVQTKAEVSYTVLGSVAQSRTPVLLQDALADERFGAQSSVLELHLRSVLCVPLISRAELIGMIYTDNRSVSGRFSQADLDMMMIFANQAATAIENAGLYEGLVEANTELEALTHTLEERVAKRTEELQAANVTLSHRAVQLETSNQVAQQIASILGLDTLLLSVVERIQTQFGYYFVGVWLLNDARDAVKLYAGSRKEGRWLIERGYTIPLDFPCVITRVCESEACQVIDDSREVSDFLRVDSLPNVASEIVLPLRQGDLLLGVLDIASDQYSQFSIEDRLVLQSLAAQIAIAIRNARLYELEQQRRRSAELLEEVGRVLTSTLDLSQVPEQVLAVLNSVVPYERGLILVEHDGVLRPAAHRGFPEDDRLLSMEVPIRDGDIYQQLSEKGHPMLIGDVTLEPGWQQVVWLPVNNSWLGIPLISKDRSIGMISLTRPDSHAFNDEDAVWGQALAAQAAIAMENARLYAEITRFNEKLEQRVQARTEELNHAYENLEQLDKTKSDFIDVSAHELRTPLTVIKGYTQILRNRVAKQKSEELERLLQGILAGTDRLHEIVNSMLDVAKIDSQTLTMVRKANSLDNIIQRVYVGFMTSLEERHISLSFSGLEKLPLVQSDADLLYKVFYQLLVNAIKYTPDGGKIALEGRTLSDKKGDTYIEICIADSGIGINRKDQELIFEKFYQIGELEFHSSGRAKFKGGGPGLGLSIARGIVLAHGGRIWVESEGCDEEVCPGSRFYVQLPVQSRDATE